MPFHSIVKEDIAAELFSTKNIAYITKPQPDLNVGMSLQEHKGQYLTEWISIRNRVNCVIEAGLRIYIS